MNEASASRLGPRAGCCERMTRDRQAGVGCSSKHVRTGRH